MTLWRTLMAPEEKAAELLCELVGSAWPGDEQVPPREDVVCRKAEVVQVVNGFAVVAAVYEG